MQRRTLLQTTAALVGATLTGARAAAPLPDLTEAEVRKIDLAAQKITLKHGEIKNIEMPPMTMVFQVKDPAWLKQFKAGDRVKFTADKIKGAYTVTSIEAAQ